MKVLELMERYCKSLFKSDEPETLAVYQALLPAIIHCEISVGDTIECLTEDLVEEITNFMHTELEMDEAALTDAQRGSVVEDTIDFVIENILRQIQEG